MEPIFLRVSRKLLKVHSTEVFITGSSITIAANYSRFGNADANSELPSNVDKM